MRKMLIGLITFLLFGLATFMLIYGIKFGNTQISSISAIKEENALLDQKIEEVSNLKAKDYQDSLKQLDDQYKKLVKEKENYEQLLEIGVDENGLPLNKIQEYEIEKIWVTMGNYAKKQGVELKMDVSLNNSVSKTYNLTFTVNGGYIQITDFLYDIERDSTLVFKLENYKMVPTSEVNNLEATFVCKDIKLKITENNSSRIQPQDEASSQNNNTNNTNNSKSNSGNSSTSNKNTTNSSTTNNTTNKTTNTTSSNTTNTTTNKTTNTTNSNTTNNTKK